MEFKEKKYIDIPIKYKTFIYFLINNKEVVYVGQTKNGLKRPFSHNDKIFNEIKIILCDEEELNILENEYIIKYNPMYNKKINRCYSMIQLRNECRRRLKNNIDIKTIKKILKTNNIKYKNNIVNALDVKKIIEYIKEENNATLF
jgi:excinuclease UvrABC nuclease subunit